tara:strand:- start:6987 stop:8069 length:1083 start_codon:yes stop_codon:yes gene_type:complete
LNYKETLFFIAKSLTISLEEKNRDDIKIVLKSGHVNWESFVKVSTNHYVMPAVYCNFKRADFLKYLPSDLIHYMQYITNLNRNRNMQILHQLEELNSILLSNKITPIFIKGSGNLLTGIYEDIGERMVGDIDFIFSKNDYPKAIKVLRNFGYTEVEKLKYYKPSGKHYRRLKKENSIAAIEIHKELLPEMYENEFNYQFVVKDCQDIKGFTLLSYANKLNLSIIANQINDNGFYYKTIALRNAYDVFLLSKKTKAKDAVNKLKNLNNPLNCFLAACYEVFNKIESLEYNNTKMVAVYLREFNFQLTNKKITKIRYKFIYIYLLLKSKFMVIYKCIKYKDYRVWLFKKVTEKIWDLKNILI